ncbi:MAG: sigma-70 family RNA polymerase sigma factor [Phycisphaerae bacterium]
MMSAVLPIPQTLQDPIDGLRRAKDDANHRWVARLIEREGPGILRMLWRLLGREQDVMDAYQDCFCKLAAGKRRGDLANAKAYAYRTATNIAIEVIRVRRRRAAHWPAIVAEQVHARPDDAAENERPDRCERLRDAIARLPDHLRNVVVLRDLSRISYDEIGRTLGIEPTTARVYRRHAVVKLAEILGEGDR